MFTTSLIYAGVVPLAIAAAVAWIVRRWGASPRATWACSVTFGLVAAEFGLKSRAGFAVAARAFIQPNEAADWLPIIVLLAVGISLLLIWAPSSRWPIAVAAVFSVAVPLRLLSGNVRLTQEWSPFEKLAHLMLLAAVFGLVWLLLASEGEEQPSVGRWLFVVIVAGGSAVVLTLSGVLVYGLSCVAVAAALTGAALASWLIPDDSGHARGRFAFRGFSGAAGPITFSLGSLIILGHYFAALSGTNASLLLASLVAAGAPLPRAVVEQPLWQQLAIRSLLCLVPLAIAITSVVA